MSFFDGIKYIFYISLIGIVVYGYNYVKGLEEDLATSKNNEILLREGLQKQEALIIKIETDYKDIRNSNDELIAITKKQQKKIEDLNTKFTRTANGSSRDFGKLSMAKPKLMTSLINKGTKNAFRCFEIISGSELKKGELNDECKELIRNNSN